MEGDVLEVKSIEDKEWNCLIVDEKGGIDNARWMPDSSHIMTFSNF